jgi:hypothetical protein
MIDDYTRIAVVTAVERRSHHPPKVDFGAPLSTALTSREAHRPHQLPPDVVTVDIRRYFQVEMGICRAEVAFPTFAFPRVARMIATLADRKGPPLNVTNLLEQSV